MLCIFGGTDKSVPYNPIVIWRSAKQQFVELFIQQSHLNFNHHEVIPQLIPQKNKLPPSGDGGWGL